MRVEPNLPSRVCSFYGVEQIDIVVDRVYAGFVDVKVAKLFAHVNDNKLSFQLFYQIGAPHPEVYNAFVFKNETKFYPHVLHDDIFDKPNQFIQIQDVYGTVNGLEGSIVRGVVHFLPCTAIRLHLFFEYNQTTYFIGPERNNMRSACSYRDPHSIVWVLGNVTSEYSMALAPVNKICRKSNNFC